MTGRKRSVTLQSHEDRVFAFLRSPNLCLIILVRESNNRVDGSLLLQLDYLRRCDKFVIVTRDNSEEINRENDRGY